MSLQVPISAETSGWDHPAWQESLHSIDAAVVANDALNSERLLTALDAIHQTAQQAQHDHEAILLDHRQTLRTLQQQRGQQLKEKIGHRERTVALQRTARIADMACNTIATVGRTLLLAQGNAGSAGLLLAASTLSMANTIMRETAGWEWIARRSNDQQLASNLSVAADALAIATSCATHLLLPQRLLQQQRWPLLEQACLCTHASARCGQGLSRAKEYSLAAEIQAVESRHRASSWQVQAKLQHLLAVPKMIRSAAQATRRALRETIQQLKTLNN